MPLLFSLKTQAEMRVMRH